MITEWIRFGIIAFLILCGLIAVFVAILGTYRFKFALNRMHTASIADTMGILFIVLAMIIAHGIGVVSVKLLFIIIFMWIASPISSHLIAKLEVMTDRNLNEHVKFEHWDNTDD